MIKSQNWKEVDLQKLYCHSWMLASVQPKLFSWSWYGTWYGTTIFRTWIKITLLIGQIDIPTWATETVTELPDPPPAIAKEWSGPYTQLGIINTFAGPQALDKALDVTAFDSMQDPFPTKNLACETNHHPVRSYLLQHTHSSLYHRFPTFSSND